MLINLLTFLFAGALVSTTSLMLVRAQGRPAAAWLTFAAVWAVLGAFVVRDDARRARDARRDGRVPTPSDLRYFLPPIAALVALGLAAAALTLRG